jgi:peroxiredoxin
MLKRIVLSLVCCGLLSSVVVAAPKVGDKVADFRLPDHLGKEHALGDLADREIVVVAFLGTECPLAKLYAGRLQKIADDYADRGVAVVAVMSNSQDSLSDIAAYAQQHEVKFPVLKDRRNEVADQFGAERTPEVFMLDRERAIRYHGRVDDQYLVGVIRDKPTREDLQVAIDELLAKKPVSVAQTDVTGCVIGRAHEPKPNSDVTYTRDIAPILNARCVQCHRAGEIGPFELTSYEEASGWGEMMAEVVREKRMPPWHADPKHGKFANDRTMPAAEKELLYKWVKNGCPEGDSKDLPTAPVFTAGWQLPREPEAVIAMPKPFSVPADAGRGGVPYQHIRVPTGFTEDKWVLATEVQPGNRAVVHHVIAYVEPPGGRGRRDWVFLSAYVPGFRCVPLPTGHAKRIPANSTLVFEMHYTPNGSVQEDKTSIGFVFADPKEIDNEVITAEIGNIDFVIPPGEAEHVVTATSQPTKQEVTLLSMSPHMHLRGAAFRYELMLPTGEREVLLDVPKYDFNWQTRYVLAEPRKLPAGSVIYCRAVYDNSDSNLANPDPSTKVRWGDQSWEEMMLGFFDVVLPRDDERRAGAKPVHTGLDIVGMFDVSDADRNGGLDKDESSKFELLVKHFAAIDTSNDGKLQLNEILNAVRLTARGR